MQVLHGTTILLVRRDGKVAIGGDGQVTLANSIILKGNARKVRRLYDNKVLVGFAGSTADATTLIDLFDKELSKNSGNLIRSAISLAKSWRTDRMLRRLEAVLAVADKEKLLMLTGNGDVIEPEHDLVAIGSGGEYARAAALAFLEGTPLSAREIVERSLKIAADICVFTNDRLLIEEIGSEETRPEEKRSRASGK